MEALMDLSLKEVVQSKSDGLDFECRLYEKQDGEKVWQIKCSTADGLAHGYWYAKGKFVNVKTEIVDGQRAIYTPVSEVAYIAPEEKVAVLKAIANWEAE